VLFLVIENSTLQRRYPINAFQKNSSCQEKSQ
jgi:hypothetical protein